MNNSYKPVEIPKPEERNDDPKKNQEVRKVERLEEELSDNYHFRYNEILCIPEFCRRYDKETVWRKMDDYQLNTIVRQLKLNGITWASKAKVAETIESDFCDRVNPLRQYFDQLPTWSGREDWIKKLCETVDTPDPAHFLKMTRKWLVATVANLYMTDRCANHLCYVLVGTQGTFKSTFIQSMMPEGLNQYYYEGDLDPESKDDLFQCTANLIYNLDDYFEAVSAKKINQLKGFMTRPKVKARRPYSRYADEMAKICSFAGTANDDTFLTDATGSRRFIPLEVTKIDIDAANAIPKRMLWAQARKLWEQGEQYWIDSTEQADLAARNEQFTVQYIEMELLQIYFKRPKSRDFADKYLTNAEILSELSTKTDARLSGKRLGEALKKLGYKKYQRRINGSQVWVYSLDVVTDSDVILNRTQNENKLTKEDIIRLQNLPSTTTEKTDSDEELPF